MDSPIRPEFLKAFAAGSLEIHCSMILLHQNTADGGHEFKGPGSITAARDRDGFTIRLYSNIQDPLQNWKRMAEDSAWHDPGMILPPESFYSLEATSLEGYVWTHPRVRVHRNYAQTGALITGRCSMLYTTAEPARVTGEEVHHLVFFSDLDIPLNKFIEQKITSGDQVLFESGRLGRAEFVHDGVQFAFEKLEEPPGSTELICRSANPLPAAFHRRIQEALRFMTFSAVSWSVSQRICDGNLTIALAATPRSPSGVWPSPVPEQEGQDFWRLFCCFLDHVCRHPEAETHHRLTANLTLLFGLQKIQVETAALALGVATEGILNSEHPNLATPATQFLAALAQLDTLARRIRCELPNLKQRVRGALQAMSARRPKDALLYLRDRGVISQDQFTAWNELRNSAAHAAVVDEDNLQERITQCFKVYELILILTFLAIGYTGKYRQTSLPGWPIGAFEKTAADLSPIVSDSAKPE